MNFERLLDGNVPLELALQASLWPLLGLLAARWLSDRPARAQVALLLGVVAAVLGVGLVAITRSAGWGLLPAASAGAATAVVPDDLQLRASGAGTTSFWPVVLLSAWMLGTLVLLARVGLAFVRGRQLVRSGSANHDEAIAAAATDAAAILGMGCPPALFLTDAVRSPAVWSWSRRPVVLLPACAPPLRRDAWRAVFLHELGHWVRRDHVAQLLVELATCLLPWQPLIWIARRRHNELCEAACDAWALHGGDSPLLLADLLVRLAQPSPQRNALQAPTVPLALSMASSGPDLVRRVRRLLDRPVTDPRAGRRWAAVVAATTLLAATGAALAHRRDAAPSPRSGADSARDTRVTDALARSIAQLDPAERSAEPLRVAPETLDLGLVPAGGAGTGVAVLVNVSDRPLHLIDYTVSCGCTTVAGFEPGVLAPGAAMPLEIRMTAPAEPGVSKTKHLIVRADRGSPVRLPITLRTLPADG